MLGLFKDTINFVKYSPKRSAAFQEKRNTFLEYVNFAQRDGVCVYFFNKTSNVDHSDAGTKISAFKTQLLKSQIVF